MKFLACIILLLAFVSIGHAQTPINAARALRPLERQGLLQPPPGSRPPTPPPQAAPATHPAAAPVYYQPPAKKTNEPLAKISKKLGISKIEIQPGKEKEDGINASLYVTNLTDEALAPFAEFTVLSTNKTDVGTEFGRIRNLGPKEVAKMQINTTKTGASTVRLVKISSKLGED